MRRKRLAMMLAVVLVPAAPGDGSAEGEKAGKNAASGFTAESNKRPSTSESS